MVSRGFPWFPEPVPAVVLSPKVTESMVSRIDRVDRIDRIDRFDRFDRICRIDRIDRFEKGRPATHTFGKDNR